jgi:hypothetical protein
MPDVRSEIEARLRACEDALGTLARRIRVLEDERTISVRTGGEPSQPAVLQPLSVDYSSILSLSGRTCVVLGGAFLLRALTDSGRLPSGGGVGLGFAYAVAWFGAAEQASRSRPISGLFHGLAGVLIGFPLLWEASMRFHLLPASVAALALAMLTLFGLGVAWHRRIPMLAGLTTAAAVITSLALAFATGALLPHLAVLVVLTTTVWWMDETTGWSWLKWPAALASNVLVLAIAARADSAAPLAPPAAALIAVATLVSAALAMVVVRTIVRRRSVRLFDVVHIAITLTAGTSAGLAVAPYVGVLTQEGVRWSLIVIGGLGYAAAFVVRARDSDARSAFHYFAALGLLLLISGLALAVPGVARDLMLASLAVGCVWLATWPGCAVLAVHSAMYVVTASVTAGLLSRFAQLWLSTAGPVPSFPWIGWVVLAAALLGKQLPRAGRSPRLEKMLTASRLALAIVVTTSVAGGLVLLLAPVVAGSAPDPGRLATLKTVTLSCIAVALATVRRRPDGAELGWLAYPVLISGGIKLLLEDLRVSPPATLFIALPIFGMALIITSRLARTFRTPVS